MSEMNIQYKMDDGVMIIELPPNVDTNLSLEYERELYSLINSEENIKTFFDAEKLDSISISELRILEKLRLEFGGMKMINLKPEVCEMVKKSGYTGLL